VVNAVTTSDNGGPGGGDLPDVGGKPDGWTAEFNMAHGNNTVFVICSK
jgi:hypothetical protein